MPLPHKLTHKVKQQKRLKQRDDGGDVIAVPPVLYLDLQKFFFANSSSFSVLQRWGKKNFFDFYLPDLHRPPLGIKTVQTQREIFNKFPGDQITLYIIDEQIRRELGRV